jgi:hypothetical protein
VVALGEVGGMPHPTTSDPVPGLASFVALVLHVVRMGEVGCWRHVTATEGVCESHIGVAAVPGGTVVYGGGGAGGGSDRKRDC